ncbi:hypothetical protein CL1_1694 [Thermococcus cleftensis]|uniref:KaiC-like domain-containing protein n=2 Tax=Thermococcaceae TaxID=2259 RepID=I3ZW07_THECF|nr:hypothetical protein CL1_1694 [Thermococcus cleftensis]NJE02704.1 hypothetical protein [Thermococcus sp. MV11]
MFFKPAELQAKEVKPFDGFPFGLGEGTLAGFVFADELSETVFLHHLASSALKSGSVYHLGPGGVLSVRLLKRLAEDVSNLYAGNVYSLDDLLKALEAVDDGSLVLASRFPALAGVSREGLLEVRKAVDRKGLVLVLGHSTIELNELDLPSEFRRFYTLPELFDALAVLRTSSYRGHYRLSITVLRAPPDYVSSLGDHSLPIDSLVKAIIQL